MTKFEKQEILYQYLDLKEECRQLSEQQEELRSILESVSAQVITDMPRSEGSVDKIGEKIARLQVEKDKYIRLYDAYTRIEDAIYSIEIAKYRSVMRLKYLQGYSTRSISRRLNVNPSTVWRWHEKALDLIEIGV